MNSLNHPKFSPNGINAITIEFGQTISPTLNQKVLQLDNYLQKNKFEGLIETVPAYSSLTVYFDPAKVRRNFAILPTAHEAVKNQIESALDKLTNQTLGDSKTIEISVSFADEFALDLKFIADRHHLKKSEVIEIFLAQTYRVYMLGFLPGFAYMGEIDERIAFPRKDSPRQIVPQGSVGIAGRQTGIYTLESPGGWQIIGKTDVELFTPEQPRFVLLQAGDLVRFVEQE